MLNDAEVLSPLVQIGPKAWVKMDCLLPGHSHKVRAAKYIVQEAIAQGHVVPHQTTLIEKTGGNFGLGLVLVGKQLGLEVELAIGLGFSPIKRAFLAAYGAKLIGVPMLEKGLQPKDVVAHHLAHADKLQKHYFFTDQFNNPGSLKAHQHVTGPELAQQVAKQCGAVRTVVFVSCAGTGAHITGIALALKQAGYAVHTVLVEPQGCDTLAQVHQAHGFEGMNVGVFPPFLQPDLIDEVLQVAPQEAKAAQSKFATDHGYYVGMTSAACLHGVELMHKRWQDEPDAVVLSLAYDLGFWYGS